MSRYRNRVYGRALQDLFTEQGGQLPAILRLSIRFLNSANGLTTPSLFKLTGDGKKTQLIKQAWDQGGDPLKFTTDTYAVAAALRLWLTMLPDSVIPSHMFSALMAVYQNEVGLRRTHALQMFMRQVPPYVIKILQPLLEFLHHYRLNQRRVNLPATDLAGIFAPLLMRPLTGTLRSPQQIEEERHIAISLTDILISEYRTVLSHRNVLPVGLKASSALLGGGQPSSNQGGCSKALNSSRSHMSAPAGINEAEADMDALVWSLVSVATSDMLFEANDMPFCRAVSSSFSSSSWSSLQSDISGSDCSSPDSSYSQGCLSPSTSSESPSLSGEESMDMEWDASPAPMMSCSDQALAPFLDATEEVCTSEPAAPAPWSTAGAGPGLMSLLPSRFGSDALTDNVPLDMLTVEQIAAEKAALKTRLESINTWFEQVAGRSLHKREKAHLKPLYVRYWKLKKALRRHP